ncbi:MAG TPA: hypothetical protein VF756_07220 [Thermoanaerobaculia bacterium]
MPRNSLDDVFHDFSSLVATARKYESAHPGIAPFRQALEDAQVRARCTRTLRDALAASKMEATQQLRLSVDEGREAVIRLRSFVKGALGSRDETLADFGMKPRRRRSRKGAIGKP